MPTVDVAIAGPDGTHLGPNETGEVLLRGPIIMPGYWNKPEATASTVIDGWLHTGDVGHLDDEGYLFITDRAKDMLIRGGENVYCVEIENRLVEHPAVADAAVIGVAARDARRRGQGRHRGRRRAPTPPTPSCANGSVRCSRRSRCRPTSNGGTTKLPRNASGKLLKNVLRGEGHVSFAETM